MFEWSPFDETICKGEVWPCWCQYVTEDWNFRFQNSMLVSINFFTFHCSCRSCIGSQLFLQHHPCLHFHDAHNDGDGLTLLNVIPKKLFLLYLSFAMVSLQSNSKPRQGLTPRCRAQEKEDCKERKNQSCLRINTARDPTPSGKLVMLYIHFWVHQNVLMRISIATKWYWQHYSIRWVPLCLIVTFINLSFVI